MRRLQSGKTIARTIVAAAVAGLLVFIACSGEVDRPTAQRRNLGQLVTMQVRDQPMYVGSYSYVDVTIDEDSGLTFGDLHFFVVDPEAGYISRSKDFSFDPDHPTFVLGAGGKVGTFLIEATNQTGDLVGTTSFGVTADWLEDEFGPPRAIWKANDEFDRTPNSLGRDPTACSPKELGWVVDNGESKKVGLVFVDTSDARFDLAQIDTIADAWHEDVFSRTQAPGNLSAARYYDEVSSGRFRIEGGVVRHKGGRPLVVQLSGGWTRYFRWDSEEEKWFAKPEFSQDVSFEASDSRELLNGFDVLMFVVQSAGDRFVWPTEYGRRWVYTGKNIRAPEANEVMRVIAMPADTSSRLRPAHTLAAHELGHSLGLNDLYSPERRGFGEEYESRAINDWDLMAHDWTLPHFSIFNKIRLGWVDEGQVRCLRNDFGAEQDEVFSLHPSAWATLQHPTTGSESAVQVRLGEGRSYFVEFRVAQHSNISDQRLPVNPAVLISEVVRARQMVLLGPEGKDGPILDAPGREFSDASENLRIITQSNLNEVLVQRGTALRPDPSIEPWDEKSFHSEDLFVRNARNWDDAANTWINDEWKYDPFGDNPNRIVARIRNWSHLDAPQVGVKFEVSLSGVSRRWQQVGPIVYQDVSSWGQELFVSDEWIPDSGAVGPNRHYCARATIIGPNGRKAYVVPGSVPPIEESDDSNNEAMSNLQRMFSKTASPSSRVAQRLEFGNPTDREQVITLELFQSNPLFRSFIEKTWLLLAPGASEEVLVMSEFVGTDSSGEVLDDFRNEENRLIVESYIAPGEFDAPRLIGGNQIEVVEGRAVVFKGLQAFVSGGEVRVVGGVREASGGTAPPGGSIILTIDSSGKLENRTIPLSAGDFSASLPRTGWDTVRAYFVPPPGWADETSITLRRP